MVEEKPHSVFKRNGSDLVYTYNITLAQALTGFDIQLRTLDGRTLNIPMRDSVVQPGDEKVVFGEGMPLAKEPGRKGNLRVQFRVSFPRRLTPEQKSLVLRALS